MPLPGAELIIRFPPTISIRSFIPTKPSRLGFLARRTLPTSNDFPLSLISIWIASEILVMRKLTLVACAWRATLVSDSWATRNRVSNFAPLSASIPANAVISARQIKPELTTKQKLAKAIETLEFFEALYKGHSVSRATDTLKEIR